MSEHECIIGLLYKHDDLYETKLSDLKNHIIERKQSNQYIKEIFHNSLNSLIVPEWELKDYCDKRKSTNLTRFEFCPYCGKKIDWKKIKEENKDEEM